MKQTPFEYLDYLTSEVDDAKNKARQWMSTALASYLLYAARNGYLTEDVPTAKEAETIVSNWISN